ncbi:serine/threonine protein kinase [Opitutaceae bacterium TAV5]|nr:serine/threonine protein kinase [Opitutaceae bacterium TAV5]
MFRIYLPPNLPDAARRDAVALKVELDFSTPPAPEILPALAMLQRWCGGAAALPPFLQLTRQQLAQLVAALAGQPVFVWLNEPARTLLWVGSHLRGVSEHIATDGLSDGRGAALPVRPRATPVTPSGERAHTKYAPANESHRRAAATPMLVDGSEHYLAIALPSREHSAYAAALDLVKTHGFRLEPSNRKWWLRDRHKTLNFLALHGEALRTGFHADFTDNFEKHASAISEAKIGIEITGSGSDFAVTLGLDADGVSEEQLRSAVAAGRGYLDAPGGRIYLLTPARMEKLAQAQRILAGGAGAAVAGRRTHRISPARAAEVQELVEELVPGYQPPAAWRRRAEALRQLATLPPAPVPAWFAAALRPYQQLGAAWLWHLYRHELGGILADEMGLGKTAQALALLSALHAGGKPEQPAAAGRRSPALPLLSLVVCPASLVENWRREAARFAPQLRVFVHHGASRLPFPAANNTGAAAVASAFDVVVTSYGTLARDAERFADMPLAVLVADEAQHVKNRRTQNARALRSLDARARFLLTGTPIENSLDDLRALFEILLPGFLEQKPSAAAGFRPEERAWFDERLRKQTAPYILRRTKQAVAPELPEKIEQIIWCEPTPAQAALYREWQERSERELFDLESGGASDSALRLATLTQLLRLRQICCDPRLVAEAAAAADSAKLGAFFELLEEAVDDGHRLLVFSQFTSLLGLLRAGLDAQGIAYCYLDGSMSPRQRQAEVDRFNASDEVPVFLISLKAGGTGLNLTGADTVVHFDPWWNPAAEAQATDRAHRIGQTRVVTSYKLICSGTVEEKVLALQEQKRALLADVFEASDAANARLGLGDLRELLA